MQPVQPSGGPAGSDGEPAGFLADERGAVLTLRAIERGLLRGEHADFRDPRWWSSVRLAFAHLELEAHRDEWEIWQRFYVAVMSSGVAEARKAAFEGLQTTTKTLAHGIRPWLPADESADKYHSLAETYRREVGDPSDPRFLAKVEAGLAESRRLRAQSAAKGLLGDEIGQRLKERDTRRAAAKRRKR